jgi:RNA recognition motif-containing protein
VARNKNQSFEKRKREQNRMAKASQKRAKRLARGSGAEGGSPPDEEDLIAEAPSKATDEEIERAIELAMNPGAQRAGAKGSKPFGKRLFVGNLDRATEEHEVGAFFREAGYNIVEATLMRDRMSGDSRGFAFVELDDGAMAKKAIEELGGTLLHGRELRINLAD